MCVYRWFLRDFGKLLGKEKPDLMVLGDRFEILAPVTCAVMTFP